MIYRGPIFLVVVHARPRHLSPVSKLDRRHKGSLRKRDNLLTGEGGGGGGRGAELYDRKKVW
jgi:hypothetical protein